MEKTTKKIGARTPVARSEGKHETIAGTVLELAKAGKTNEEITKVLQQKFKIPDKHKHYAGWYRGQAVRRGQLPASLRNRGKGGGAAKAVKAAKAAAKVAPKAAAAPKTGLAAKLARKD